MCNPCSWTVLEVIRGWPVNRDCTLEHIGSCDSWNMESPLFSLSCTFTFDIFNDLPLERLAGSLSGLLERWEKHWMCRDRAGTRPVQWWGGMIAQWEEQSSNLRVLFLLYFYYCYNNIIIIIIKMGQSTFLYVSCSLMSKHNEYKRSFKSNLSHRNETCFHHKL